jgi:hypothetical protein
VRATPSEDRLRVRLEVAELVAGGIYYLRAGGVRSADGVRLEHPEAVYTLHHVPRGA